MGWRTEALNVTAVFISSHYAQLLQLYRLQLLQFSASCPIVVLENKHLSNPAGKNSIWWHFPSVSRGSLVWPDQLWVKFSWGIFVWSFSWKAQQKRKGCVLSEVLWVRQDTKQVADCVSYKRSDFDLLIRFKLEFFLKLNSYKHFTQCSSLHGVWGVFGEYF